MSAFEIPESAFPRCLACGEAVRPSPLVLFEISGFERDRSAGGTNHVIARKRTGRVVGSCCSELVQYGMVAQGSLLAENE